MNSIRFDTLATYWVPMNVWQFDWYLPPAVADLISDAIYTAIVWPEQ